MSEPFEFEQVHIVAYGLLRLLDDACHLLQGIEAFGDKHPDRITNPTNEDWFSLAYSALLKNLAIDIASLLDRAKYRKDSNCNFRELKFVLEVTEERKKRFQKVLDEIDELLGKYKNVVPDTLRNKVIAHRDLEELFSGEEYNVDLIEIKRFLHEGHKTISDVFSLAFGFTLKDPDIDAIKRKYEQSLSL